MALAYLAAGYNAFVLRYTTGPDCPLDKALADAQAALAYLRAGAGELHIDPDKIAAVGFSAGGHLAAALGTRSRLRPNALVLGYAVTLGATWAPFGRKDEPDLGGLVDAETPPAYIFATQGDTLVPVANSLAFAQALAAQDIPFSLHIFPTGEHGLSLAQPTTCGGEAGRVNAEAAAWLPGSLQFLQKLWGALGVVAPDAELAAQLAELDPHEVPLNFLNPRPGTPFGDLPLMESADALRTIAAFRLAMPRTVLRAGRPAGRRQTGAGRAL